MLNRHFQAVSISGLTRLLNLHDSGTSSVMVINPCQPSSILSLYQKPPRQEETEDPGNLTLAPAWAIGLPYSRHLAAGLCFSPGTATAAEAEGNQQHAGRGCSGGHCAGKIAAPAERTCGARAIRLGSPPSAGTLWPAGLNGLARVTSASRGSHEAHRDIKDKGTFTILGMKYNGKEKTSQDIVRIVCCLQSCSQSPSRCFKPTTD